MEYLKAGLDSFRKYLPIILYVGLAGLVTGLIEYFSTLTFETSEFVAIMAVVNYLLKAVLTWATTKAGEVQG